MRRYTCKHSELAVFSLPSPHFLVGGAAPRLASVLSSRVSEGVEAAVGGLLSLALARLLFVLLFHTDKHGQHGDGVQQAELQEDPKEEKKSAD